MNIIKLFFIRFTKSKRRHDFLLLEEYLGNCERLNKSPETIRNYRSDIQQFLRWYHRPYKQPVVLVTGAQITAYQELLHSGNFTLRPGIREKLINFWRKKHQEEEIGRNPLSISSQKRHLSSLKNFFEYLLQRYGGPNGWPKENPVKEKIHGIKLKEIDIIHTQTLTRKEFNILYEKAYRALDRAMLLLLYYGGLRLEELSGLTFGDFLPERKIINLRRKGGYRHELRAQKFDLIWQTLQGVPGSSSFLFVNKKGNKLSKRSLYQRIKNHIEKAGLSSNLGPHSFRKGCATELYRNCKDLLYVRDYLNHHDAKVTQTYIDTEYLYSPVSISDETNQHQINYP